MKADDAISETAKNINTTVKDVENSLPAISESKQRSKYRYDVINKDKNKTEDILDFVPITSKDKKDNQIVPHNSSSYQHKKRKVGLLGSKPSRGFRSSSSQGYHSSTSQDNFLKKKYVSARVDKATRRVLPGSLQNLPKKELYQHIMQQYRKDKIKTRKKKLRRKQKRHRSIVYNCIL